MSGYGSPFTPLFRLLASAWSAALVLGVASLFASVADAQESGRHVVMTTVAGPITPVIAAQIDDGIERAKRSVR